MYYVYILRCSDNSLYTGITPDIERRIYTHYHKLPGCAKYTKSHDVVGLEALWTTEDKISAAKIEYRIKKLTKSKKLSLIAMPHIIDEILCLGEFTAVPCFDVDFEKAIKKV